MQSGSARLTAAINRAVVPGVALLLMLACLLWALLLTDYADFDTTSFWDGYCSSNEPWFGYTSVASGVVGIALTLWLSWRAFRAGEAGRPIGWLFVVAAISVAVGWNELVAAIEPETHSLPPAACGYGD